MVVLQNEIPKLTHNDIPEFLGRLFLKVENLERLLISKGNQQSESIDVWFDLSQLCDYHPDKPARQTVYGWISTGIIPHHKSGKKLRFLKSEIDEWLLNGRKKTTSEVSGEADAYLSTHKKAH